MTFRLSKLHGLGNDFLVLLTDDPSVASDREAWADRAVAWCDRRTGVGADGLILGVSGGGEADLVMHLYNADGSRAEMSGNGIRCLVHAEVRRLGRLSGSLRVQTDGGLRTIRFESGTDPLAITASVDMGAGAKGPEPDRDLAEPWRHEIGDPTRRMRAGLEVRQWATYDFGNPHLVLQVEDPDWVDIGLAGSVHEARFSDGINVHAMAPTAGEDDAITVHHSERGVGPTMACGTGACASALAAHEWGLVGERVTVHMPGGDAEVEIGETIVLHGPSVFIADVEVPA
jgi:diaminopimelate epimerase